MIGVANANPGADTITFDPAILPGKITLSLEINILDTLTIKGPGIDLLPVSGNDLVRIFNIGDGTVALKPTTISGNVADASGGAIFAQPTSVLNLTGNKFTENRALYGGAINMIGNMGGQAVTANLSGNLFQANVAEKMGGAVAASGASKFTSKSDRFIGNVVTIGQGGGVFLANTGGIFITGSLFQGNVAGSSGGGLNIQGGAILTSVKVLENIAGPGGRGGGLRIDSANVFIFKSVITGNVANDGGGIVNTVGTTTLDAATRAATKGNSAGINPNTVGV